MKKVVYSLMVFFLTVGVAVSQNTVSPDGGKDQKKELTKDEIKAQKKAPEILFESTTHDFGKLAYGADCSFEFTFKNTGKSDLILSNVRPTCGCTIAEGWQQIGPVKKGKTAKVKISYDSKRVGAFNKTITVTSNAKNDPVQLIIKGEIEPQKQEEKK